MALTTFGRNLVVAGMHLRADHQKMAGFVEKAGGLSLTVEVGLPCQGNLEIMCQPWCRRLQAIH